MDKKIGSEFAYDSLPFQSKEKNYEDYEVKKILLSQFADVRRQPRFITRRRISVQNAFVNRFINRRNGRR